jgi:diguanylate cyclase (GGDEF)-like protein
VHAGARVLLVGRIDDLGAIDGIPVEEIEPDAFATEREGVVAILDRRAFESTGAMVAARAVFPGRVLFVGDAASLAELTAGMRPDDDLALASEPTTVLAHRLKRLMGPRDGLSGLAPRTTWEQELERCAAHASVAQPVSIAIFDVDRFKAINDHHGHAAGDRILAALAERLVLSAPGARVVARLGGELFGVLSHASEADATATAERALSAVREAPIDGIEVRWSAGVATTDEPVAPRELWREADEALYTAKARGRDRAVHASATRRESAREGTDAHLESFEDFTRVIAERVAEVIARRGRRIFAELREQADMDALTDLYSRRYLDRRLPFEVDQAEGAQVPLTVALLDIDHFGLVNKEHGWPTGDRVLAAVADAARGAVRSSDWVARYGGEELCVVLADTDLERARSVLERIRGAIGALSIPSADGVAITVTVSLGAVERLPGESVEAMVERVSDRLLEAKAAGRNCVRT